MSSEPFDLRDFPSRKCCNAAACGQKLALQDENRGRLSCRAVSSRRNRHGAMALVGHKADIWGRSLSFLPDWPFVSARFSLPFRMIVFVVRGPKLDGVARALCRCFRLSRLHQRGD